MPNRVLLLEECKSVLFGKSAGLSDFNLCVYCSFSWREWSCERVGQISEFDFNHSGAMVSESTAMLDIVKIGIMTTVQMIPHRLVGVVTSVSFEPFCVACEALPEVSMTVPLTKTTRSMDECEFVGAPQMLDNFAQRLKVLLVARHLCAHI